MVNTILAKRGNHIVAKGGNHIVAKGGNPVWPKGSKSRGFSKLHNAATFYAQYQSEMEKLFVALKYHHVHPSFLQDDFFSQKKMAAKYLAITNDFYRGLPSKIETNIHNEFDEYVREIYP